MIISYLSISAVRLKYQIFGMVIPQFIAMLGSTVYFFLLPFLRFNGDKNPKIELLYIPWEDDLMTKRFICQMIASFCAFASFTIATRHVWFDRCYPYALERALFESVIFRGAWTPVHLGRFYTPGVIFTIFFTDKTNKSSSSKKK